LRGSCRLAGVQRGLLLGLYGAQGLAFGLLEQVELARALQHLGVVVGALGHAAGGQPVVEGFALGLVVADGLAVLQLCLFQRGLRVLLGVALGADGVAQRAGLGLVQKIIDLQRAFHLGQIAHDGAAQANQKAGEHHRHQPQTTPEPLLRQTQGFAHGCFSR